MAVRSTSRKRPRPKCFDDLSCVKKSANASLQGVVHVEEMKKGKSGTAYFNGTIADEKKSLRVFGYDIRVRDKILETIEQSDGGGMKLKHCEVKGQKSERGDGFEVHDHITMLATPVLTYIHQQTFIRPSLVRIFLVSRPHF